MAAIPGTEQFFHALFQASWGLIPLFCSAVKTDNSRTQVVHDLVSGDTHPIQDRGLRARRVHVDLLFDQFPNQGTPIEMFRRFKAQVDSGVLEIFTHPIDGSFLARVGEFTYEIDANSNITNATAEFISEQAIVPFTPAGVATGFGDGGVAPQADHLDAELVKLGSPISHALDDEKLSPVARARLLANTKLGLSLGGTEDVSAGVGLNLQAGVGLHGSAALDADAKAEADARAALNASLETSTDTTITSSLSASASAAVSVEIAAGVFGGLTTDAMASVNSWSEGEEGAPTRQVVNDVARISDNIATMIEVGGFESDLALWPAYRAAILFGEAVRAAAISATSEVPSVFVMRVTAPTALLPLAARIYGGAEAARRARQIARLNDIRSPAWLGAGDYLMPTRTPTQRPVF